MTLLELIKLVEGKYPEGASEGKPCRFVTVEELNEFRQYLAINPVYMTLLGETASAEEFYDACPLFAGFPKELQEDLFYAIKLGFTFTGVPSKLVYMLRMALGEAKAPNLALEMLNGQQLHKYLKASYLPVGVTVKQVMSNLLGNDFKTLSNARKKVAYKDFYEVYVANVDRVLLLPPDIAGQLNSRADIESINYNPELGVCAYDTPLRTMCGRAGITTDEFDLRKCL